MTKKIKQWILHSPKLKCPKCNGTDRIGHNELVAIRQDVKIDQEGRYEFTGENEVFWESSEYLGRSRQGEREWWCQDCSIEFDAPNLLQHH